MVLATIIRLEMAYPGVGILAGDSLQYLSVVTAHAVIMVFFMIMPLLFGAFGNFLLPTQLGVHDVAFPRLNSAAFWFLPAGLLMLGQLVCLDRRYQRMNCYNIREIQTILKSKYTPNTSDSSDVRFSLNDTTIGLRYQLGALESVTNSTLNFYQNALTSNSPHTTLYSLLTKPLSEFETVAVAMRKSTLLYVALTSGIDSMPTGTTFSTQLTTALTLPSNLVRDLSSCVNVTLSVLTTSLTSTPLLVTNFTGYDQVKASISHGTPVNTFSLPSVEGLAPLLTVESNVFLTQVFTLSFANYATLVPSPASVNSYVALGGGIDSLSSTTVSTLQEKTSDSRFMRLMNPVFKYDFKVGNYLPDDAKKMNPHLFMSIKDVTTGVRKSS